MPRSGRRAGVIISWALVTLATGTLSACGGATATGIEPAARRPAPAAVDNASKPGEPVAEPATFHSLGVRWAVRGDANSDAVIGVRYRRHGETTWREALPLFRTDPESVSEDNRVLGGWLFAGSIVDLAPDTAYEVTLALIDPDGGGVERALDMKTGAEPREPAGMRVQHVVPAGGADRGPGTGTATDPFRGLRIAQGSAMPGDLFLLHAGVYGEGTWTIDRHGTPERPIIYRGAGDGEAILDGGGRERLVSADGALYRRYGAVLVNARGNFASGLGPPWASGTRFPGERTDLRLDPASRAVDAGVGLPNFNDGFAGKAPDLGCCELGQPLPHYGPRP